MTSGLTKPQKLMLKRLVEDGPFTPTRAEWVTFRGLEAMKLAAKVEFTIIATDMGRLKFHGDNA